MRLPYLKLDSSTTEFMVTDWEEKEHRFPGTVEGAAALNRLCHDQQLDLMMSSDLNHPDEFPKFEEHAIDIAAGYYAGAVKAGLIKMITDEEE